MNISKALLGLGKDVVSYLAEVSEGYSKNNNRFNEQQREYYRNFSNNLNSLLDNWEDSYNEDSKISINNSLSYKLTSGELTSREALEISKQLPQSPLMNFFFGEYIKKYPKFFMYFSDFVKDYNLRDWDIMKFVEYWNDKDKETYYNFPYLFIPEWRKSQNVTLIYEDHFERKWVDCWWYGDGTPEIGSASRVKYKDIKSVKIEKINEGYWLKCERPKDGWRDSGYTCIRIYEDYEEDDMIGILVKIIDLIRMKNKNIVCDLSELP